MQHARLLQELYAEQIMVMPAMQKRRWTEREVRRLIEDAPEPTPRYELVDGELLVTPSPSRDHQRVVRTLLGQLQEYVHGIGAGEALSSPSDVRLGAEVVLQPDIYVLPREDNPSGGRGMEPERLLLAVEVVSPGSARLDRVEKRRAYLKANVPEYWVVDLDTQLIERWRQGDTRADILDELLVWEPAVRSAVEPLKLDIERLFQVAELKGD